MHNTILGKKGEDMVVSWIKKKGYRVLKRNYKKYGFGEIDIIAEDLRKKQIVFIEVKTRMNNLFGSPRESVHLYKIRHLKKIVYYYLMCKEWEERDFRIDVIEVMFVKGRWMIEQIENAVEE